MAGEIARLWVTVDANTRPLKRGLQDVERQAKGTTRVFSNFERKLALIGGAAAGLGIKKAADQVIGFDKAMRNVNSIAQLSERRFATLSKSVLNLSGKTAQAPITLAEGLYDLVSSGFDASQSLTVLKSSAKAATAGLTDTATSTKAVAAVLNAYHLSAKDAGKVSDILFKTVDRGVITFETLAQNVGDVLPFATALNVKLEDVGAATATMTKAGVSGAETMTRIKGAMVALIRPSEQMNAVYKELGVRSGQELIRKTGSFQGALEALSKAVGGNKQAMAKLFPDIRGLGGALLLTGKNAQSAGADLKGMEGASGATSKALSQQSKSLSYQWNKLKAEAASLAISVGNDLVPAFRRGLRDVAGFVKEMRTGKGAGGEFARTMGDVARGVGDVLRVAKDVATFLVKHPVLLKAAAGAWVAYKAAALAQIALVKAAELGLFGPAMVTKMKTTGGAAGTATGRAFAAKAGLAAAAGIGGWEIGKWLRKNVGPVKDAGDFIGRQFGEAFFGGTEFQERVDEMVQQIRDAYNNAFGGLSAGVQGAVDKSTRAFDRAARPYRPKTGRGKGGPQGTGKISAKASVAGPIARMSGEAGGAELGSLQSALAWAQRQGIIGALIEDQGAANQHLHINAAADKIVAIGKALQAAGFAVGEHPAFGGVHNVHMQGSYHYSGMAIDVNADYRSLSMGGATPVQQVRQTTKKVAENVKRAVRKLSNFEKLTRKLDYTDLLVDAGIISARGGELRSIKQINAALGGLHGANRLRALAERRDARQELRRMRPKRSGRTVIDWSPLVQARLDQIDLATSAGVNTDAQALAMKIATLRGAIPSLSGNAKLSAMATLRGLTEGAGGDGTTFRDALERELAHKSLYVRAGDISEREGLRQSIDTINANIGNPGLTDEDRLELRAELGDLIRALKDLNDTNQDLLAVEREKNALLDQQNQELHNLYSVSQAEEKVLGRTVVGLVNSALGSQQALKRKTPLYAGSRGVTY